MIDTLSEKECRIWCWLWWAKEEDLTIIQIHQERYEDLFYPPQQEQYADWSSFKDAQHSHLASNGVPEWFFYEMTETSLSEMMAPGFSWNEWAREAFFAEPWTEFGLTYGIAPKQPFLLSIGQPHYSCDRDGDTDVEYDWDVIQIEPWSRQRVLYSWDLYFKSFPDDCYRPILQSPGGGSRETV